MEQDHSRRLELEDIEVAESIEASWRARALGLSEFWVSLGYPAAVNVPEQLREVGDRAVPDRLTGGGLLSDVAFAEAVLAAADPPQHRSVSRLRRDGEFDKAEMEQFHDELTVLLRRIHRRRSRLRDVLETRVQRLLKALP